MHRQLRLRNRKDFTIVYRNGTSFANHQFIVYWRKQRTADPFRLGVSASKKIGNAVVRNRMRRMVKEIVRQKKLFIKPHIDFIIIVRRGAVDLDFHQLEKSINHLLKKSNLLTG